MYKMMICNDCLNSVQFNKIYLNYLVKYEFLYKESLKILNMLHPINEQYISIIMLTFRIKS
jgi:hypothetical protein